MNFNKSKTELKMEKLTHTFLHIKSFHEVLELRQRHKAPRGLILILRIKSELTI